MKEESHPKEPPAAAVSFLPRNRKLEVGSLADESMLLGEEPPHRYGGSSGGGQCRLRASLTTPLSLSTDDSVAVVISPAVASVSKPIHCLPLQLVKYER